MPGDRYLIEGGQRLEGRVRASGNKNATVHAMAATLLTGEECRLENVPSIVDVRNLAGILRALGAHVEFEGSTLVVNAAGVSNSTVPSELAVNLRASFLAMGPLLARTGRAACAPPGGDIIGLRPLDVHLSGFAALGAKIGREDDKFSAEAERLRGARIFMDYPSVLGTQNVMMAAVLADGKSVLVNAAAEPEVGALAEMLNKMGARISGAGSHTIEIEGVEKLHGVTQRIIPDRIEAGTLAIAAAITRGSVVVEEAVPRQLDALIWKLREAGVEVGEDDGSLSVSAKGKLRAINVQSVPYPGLATDLLAPLAVLLTQAEGVSFVYERVFDNRLLYVGELRKMGAEVMTAGTTAIISGPAQLNGTRVRAVDLRAGAALALAGLAAKGSTEISDIYHLDRGYEDLEGKLGSLGAIIKRI